MTQPIIIFLLVLSIWYTMQEGEIFEKLGKWFEKNLPKKLHQPVFACNVCMTPWYGSALYWLIYGNSIADWLVTIIAAMGLQVVLNKVSPKKHKPLLEVNVEQSIELEKSNEIKERLKKDFPDYDVMLLSGGGVHAKLHSVCG